MMNRSRAVAIILGSKTYPFLAEGYSKMAFAASAERFLKYVSENNGGLGLCNDEILNLFDHEGNVDDQDRLVASFLGKWHSELNVVLIYYVGHGGFLGDRQHFLFIKNTDPRRKHITGWKSRDIAETIKSFSGGKKIFLILDCCFAGAFIDQFQSGEVGHIVESQVYENYPASGVALLAASSRDEPAITLDGGQYTMLNEALMDVLINGIETCDDFMSLRDVAEATASKLRNQHGLNAVRPEVHTPRQINNDVADIQFFPNNRAAFTQRSVKLPRLLDRIKEERYISDLENDFGNWPVFHSPLPPGQAKRHTAAPEVIDGVRAYRLRTEDGRVLGVNKTLEFSHGIVTFQYIVRSTSRNITFYVIPMETGDFVTPARRTPNHEIWRSDKRELRNPLRVFLEPNPQELDRWLDGEVYFDFRQLKRENTIFSMFAPRINEGVAQKGPGHVIFAKIRAYAFTS